MAQQVVAAQRSLESCYPLIVDSKSLGAVRTSLVKALGFKAFLSEPWPHIAINLLDRILVRWSRGHDLFAIVIEARVKDDEVAEACILILQVV